MVKQSGHIVSHEGVVCRKDREALLGQNARTIWLTGLSAAGKSTLAFALEKLLTSKGYVCFVLDGDNVRQGLNKNLSFSIDDRSENIRRVAEVARLMNEAGLIVITALISPFTADREVARRIVGRECFREVYVNTPLAVCESRDPKGLYGKARSGALSEFTGVSSPYEPPESPDWVIDAGLVTIDMAVDQLTELTLR